MQNAAILVMKFSSFASYARELGDERRQFYGGLLNVRDGEDILVCVSPTVLDAALRHHVVRLQADATFDVVPAQMGCRQLFIVHILIGDVISFSFLII